VTLWARLTGWLRRKPAVVPVEQVVVPPVVERVPAAPVLAVAPVDVPVAPVVAAPKAVAHGRRTVKHHVVRGDIVRTFIRDTVR